jgi:6-phosphofructokinase 1
VVAGISSMLQQHQIDALVVIGGFEGYTSVLDLEKKAEQYPALRIPMVSLLRAGRDPFGARNQRTFH